jgi:hypothetical protein
MGASARQWLAVFALARRASRRMTVFDRVVREHELFSLFFARTGPMPEASQ